MDSTSIITQVSRDDEQLTSFPTPEKEARPTLQHAPSGVESGGNLGRADSEPVYVGASTSKKPRSRGLFSSFFCCFAPTESNSSQQNAPSSAQENGEARVGEIGGVYTIDKVHNSTATTSENGNISCAQPPFLLQPLIHMDKKCVVIDLDETLVHSSFKPVSNADFIVPVEIDGTTHQVYVLKRPYVDEFLQKMGELFECVLFTASLAKYADPVADLLDKWGVFTARLFRESCVFHRGNYVKDLSRLGRDLTQVVIIDNSPASYIFHPDNAVPVASWFDDMSDTELLDLIPFFEGLAKVDNVYSVLRNANT